MSTITLEARLADTTKTKLHEPFVDWLRYLAKENEKTPTDIWHLWQEYSKKCEGFDQSPARFEFLQWYKLAGEPNY